MSFNKYTNNGRSRMNDGLKASFNNFSLNLRKAMMLFWDSNTYKTLPSSPSVWQCLSPLCCLLGEAHPLSASALRVNKSGFCLQENRMFFQGSLALGNHGRISRVQSTDCRVSMTERQQGHRKPFPRYHPAFKKHNNYVFIAFIVFSFAFFGLS